MLRLAVNLPATFPNWFSLFLLSNIFFTFTIIRETISISFRGISDTRARFMFSLVSTVHVVSPFRCGGSVEYLAGDNYFN